MAPKKKDRATPANKAQAEAALLDAALLYSLAKVPVGVDPAKAKTKTRGLEVTFRWSSSRANAFWLFAYINYKTLELCRLIDGRTRASLADVEEGLALVSVNGDELKDMLWKTIDDGVDGRDDLEKDAERDRRTVAGILSDMMQANLALAGHVSVPGMIGPDVVSPVKGELSKMAGRGDCDDDDDDDDDDDYIGDAGPAGRPAPPSDRVIRNIRVKRPRCAVGIVDHLLETAPPLYALYKVAKNEHAGRTGFAGPDDWDAPGSEDDDPVETLDPEDQRMTKVAEGRPVPPRIVKSAFGDETSLALAKLVPKAKRAMERKIDEQEREVKRLIALPGGADPAERRNACGAAKSKLDAMRNTKLQIDVRLEHLVGTNPGLRRAAVPSIQKWLLAPAEAGPSSGLAQAVRNVLQHDVRGRVLALPAGPTGEAPTDGRQKKHKKMKIEGPPSLSLVEDDAFLDSL